MNDFQRNSGKINQIIIGQDLRLKTQNVFDLNPRQIHIRYYFPATVSRGELANLRLKIKIKQDPDRRVVKNGNLGRFPLGVNSVPEENDM
ncbi:unnamed protein product [Ambrosiozyma monospora]|uniref:Unnamed protein product n=1 Tax=Ambrosiozyma monospora TaxID=43982 RepID=A0A9W6WA79_AMBMO|nr:unnamed protein product [Ambrosiozyma monospora]